MHQNWNKEYNWQQWRSEQSDPIGLAVRISSYIHSNNAPPVTALDQHFAYDNLNRLLDATNPTGTQTQFNYYLKKM
ncbi:MAG: hypothetical protein WCH35_15685 [Comamonadaceae bacterium]